MLCPPLSVFFYIIILQTFVYRTTYNYFEYLLYYLIQYNDLSVFNVVFISDNLFWYNSIINNYTIV